MKKISIIAGLAALTALFTGCIKEEAPATPEVEVKLVRLTLSTDDYPVIGEVETKTELVKGKVHWKKGDMIKVNIPSWSGYDENDAYYLTNKASDGETAVFDGYVPQKYIDHGKLAIMFPFKPSDIENPETAPNKSRRNRLKGTASWNGSWTNHCSNVHFPSPSQGLEKNSFGYDSCVSFAQIDLNNKETSNKITFKNATGLYEIKLRGNINISKIEIISSQDITIAETHTNSNLFYSLDDNNLFTCGYKDLGSKTVTLTNEDGVQLGDESIGFYACVAPYTNENATCTIKVYEKDHEEAPVLIREVLAGSVAIGKITRLGEFDVNVVGVPEKLYLEATQKWEKGTDLQFLETDTRIAARFLNADGSKEVWKDAEYFCQNRHDDDHKTYSIETAGNEYPKVAFYIMAADSENNTENALLESGELNIPRGGENMFRIVDDNIANTATNAQSTWSVYNPVIYFSFKDITEWIERYDGGDIKNVAVFYNTPGVDEVLVDMTLYEAADCRFTAAIPGGCKKVKFCQMKDGELQGSYTPEKVVRSDRGKEYVLVYKNGWYSINFNDNNNLPL